MSSILNSRAGNRVAVCAFALFTGIAAAQALHPAPDFSDGAVSEGSEQAAKAWNDWLRGDRDLEREVLNASMSDARDRIQRSFSALLNYTDKRRIYADRVADYIERYRPETAGRKKFVDVVTVDLDQLELLGMTESGVQAHVDALRDTPVWATVRRSVQTDMIELPKLQTARRSEIPEQLPLAPAIPPRPLSVILYRDSERQTRELVERIWTHYYQALVDAVEQKKGAPKPLVASITPPAAEPAPAAEAAPSASPAVIASIDRLVGTWRYVDGSQQFNGVDEPRQVILELFAEKGVLSGRYRATLTDFDGPHKVDVRLERTAAKGATDLRFLIRNADQIVPGQISVEGPGPSGLELMVVHLDAAGIPKGREVLARR